MARNFIFQASAEEQEVIMNMYVNAVAGRLREVQSPSESYSARWIWELIQNASDSIVGDPSRKSVNVEIIANNKEVIFKHNGSPFNRRTFLALLYKYSQGKRNTLSTGRFGTGFMTTHCLSTIIDIAADIVDERGLSGFAMTMYRNGFDEEELMEGLRKTNASLKETNPMGWTKYRYQLKSDVNKKSRDLGLQSFRTHIVETFLFCQRLESITLTTPQEKVRIYRGERKQEGSFTFQEVIREEPGRKIAKKFLILERKWGRKDEETMQLAVDVTEGKLMDNQNRACLFCTFPLVGSEKHQFPFLFNCHCFEPDAERKSLLLRGPDTREGRRTPQAINKMILMKATEVFRELIGYLIKQDYKDMARLTNGLLDIPIVDNIDGRWYDKNFLETMRSILLNSELVYRESPRQRISVEKAMFLKFSDKQNEEQRKMIHALACRLNPNVVTYECAWEWQLKQFPGVKFWDIKNIAEGYSRCPVAQHSFNVWNELLLCIDTVDKRIFQNYALIPNMKGEKMKCDFRNPVWECKSVTDEMLRCMDTLGIPWEREHVHNSITSLRFSDHTMHDACMRINQEVQKQSALAFKLVRFVPEGDVAREEIYHLASHLLPDIGPVCVCSSDFAGEDGKILWGACDKDLAREMKRAVTQLKREEVARKLPIINDFLRFAEANLPRRETIERDRLVPNALCELRKIQDLRNNRDLIPDQFRSMMKFAYGVDISSWEIHSDIDAVEAKYDSTIDQHVNTVVTQFQVKDSRKKHHVTKCILSLLPSFHGELYERQYALFSLYKNLIDDSLEECVADIPERLWTLAKTHAITEIKDAINQMKTLDEFCATNHVSEEEAIEMLNKCYELDPQIKVPNCQGDMLEPGKLFHGSTEITDELLDLMEKIDPDGKVKRSTLADGRIKNEKIKPIDFLKYLKKAFQSSLANDGQKVEGAVTDIVTNHGLLLRDRKTLSHSEKTVIELLIKVYVNSIKNRLRELNHPSESDEMRWAWELLQNAKDTISDIPDRKINVTIDVFDNEVVFTHDGKPFTYPEMLALVFKCSQGKDPRKNSTGRFGTGFVSTHTLSRVVEIETDLLDESKRVIGFKATLYREGTNEDELKEGAEKTDKSCCSFPDPFGHTAFRYKLISEKSKEIRDKGLTHFKENLPLSMIFEPQIGKVEIHEHESKTSTTYSGPFVENGKHCVKIQVTEDGGNKLSFSERWFICKKAELPLVESIAKREGITISRPIPGLAATGISVPITCLLEIDGQGNVKWSSRQESFFCVFPLLGSRQYRFPMVVNCPFFEPTTERNGILLHGKVSAKKKDEISEADINRCILSQARDMFPDMLATCAEMDIQKPYMLARGLKKLPVAGRETFDKEWYTKHIMNPMREYIQKARLFRSQSGLQKLDDVLLPNLKSEEAAKEEFWNVAELLFTKLSMPTVPKEEAKNWSRSVWDEFPFSQVQTVVFRYEKFGKAENLPFDGEETWNFINRFLASVQILDKTLLDKNKLIPDASGEFAMCQDLCSLRNVSQEMLKLCQRLKIVLHYVNPKITLQIDGMKVVETLHAVERVIEACKDQHNAFVLMNYTPKEDDEKRKGLLRWVKRLFPEISFDEELTCLEGIDVNMWRDADTCVVKQIKDKIVGTRTEPMIPKELNELLTFIKGELPGDWRSLKSEAIFPDRNGNLHKLEELQSSVSLPGEILSLIANKCGIDLDSHLLHEEIKVVTAPGQYKLENVASDVLEWWDSASVAEDKDEVALKLLGCISHERVESLLRMYGLFMQVDSAIADTREILDESKYHVFWKYIMTKVLTKVESLGTLNGITEITGDEKKSIDALNTLFVLIKSRNKVVMPSFDEAILYTAREDTKHFKNAGAIIPNQLGKLCHHHSLHRDDRIPEELLEMQRVLIPGEDWRVQLADTRIQDIGLEPWKRDDVVMRMDGPIYLKQSKFTEGASEELKAALTNFVDYCDKHALSQLIPRTRVVYSKLSPSTLEESVQKGQISLEKFNNRQQSAIRRLIEQMEQLPEDRKEMTMSILEMTPEQQIEMVSLYQKHKKDREAMKAKIREHESLVRLLETQKSIPTERKEAQFNLVTTFVNELADENDPTIYAVGYTGEALVYEQLSKCPKFTNVKWLQLADSPAYSYSLNLGTRTYHISETGAPYDLTATDENGRECFIEVKSTRYDATAPLHISANQLHFLRTSTPNRRHLLARVYRVQSQNPDIVYFEWSTINDSLTTGNFF